MNLLTGNIHKLYREFLAAAFGSAIVSSIYSVVDMAMVGHYQGPQGTAALAVVAPVWNIIYSFGLLMGIGGSVIFSMKRGAVSHMKTNENQYFTTALTGSLILAVLSWIVILVKPEPVLYFFGADEELLSLALAYLRPIQIVFPSFLFNQMLAAFLRNDHDPKLASAAVLAGGIFNIFGDWFFVFPCDMGMYGAGLATAIGSLISTVTMLSHFASGKNTLKIEKPEHFLHQLKRISITGFSTFFSDAAMGIITVLFNRQIMKYLGPDALAVYGPIVNISTFVQCCAYSVGQASQPIISTNFGARNGDRIRETLQYALHSAAFFGIFWTVLSIAVPNLYVRIFMTPTPDILSIAPRIIRIYSISFLLLPFNVFSTYYFQSIAEDRTGMIVSLSRGMFLSGSLILFLPAVFGGNAVWLAMPVTELLTALFAGAKMRKDTNALPVSDPLKQVRTVQ